MAAADDMKEAAFDAVDFQWVEVPCTRSLADAQFSAGVADFQFSISKPMGFVPSASYMRIELELLGQGNPEAFPPAAGAAGAPTFAEGIAFAENAAANLWSNAYMRAGGQDVSSITSFLPQAGMIHMRTGKTSAWLRSNGKHAWGMSGSFSERCAAVSQSAPNNPANPLCGVAAPIGLSGMDDRREVSYKPTVAGQFINATVGFAAAGNTITGVQTLFTADDVGNTIVADGQKYTVLAFASSTSITVSAAAPAIVAPTKNWYMLKRNVLRSAEARNKTYVLWKPPIGIFDAEDLVLGSGDFRLSLTPDSNYQQTAVETINDSPLPGVNGVVASTYTLRVKSATFYAATIKLKLEDSVQTLHLKEYLVQQRVMNADNLNLSWSVPASTSVIHVMLQDNLAGSSARVPPSNFKMLNGQDMGLTTFQITYDNTTFPQTRWASSFQANNPAGRTNSSLLEQLYHQSLVARRADNNPGGAESFNEWLDRGPLLSTYWARDASSRSTDVQLQIGYSNPSVNPAVPFDITGKIYLIAEYDRTVEITTSNGMVTAVRSLNV